MTGKSRKKTAKHGMQRRTKKTNKINFDKSTEIRRIKSGIPGLDELIEGGILEKSVILLTGSTGTGKTIFALKFLIEGALKNEAGVYISLQETPQENIDQMNLFGWPIKKLIKENKILIIQPELYNFDSLLTTIEDSVEKVKAKRLVIDAASIIGLYFENPYKVRKSLLELTELLKKLGCTTIAIDEISENEKGLSAFGVEEFITDGVIIMYYVKKPNEFIRAITVRKMRSTKHSKKIHVLQIKKPEGIVVSPDKEVKI
jgi:KaiC/GvpD/RAD55 family RecA-like ATPase